MVAKIVHVVAGLGRGGAETQLFYLASALSERGWPQAVISFDSDRGFDERLESLGIPVLRVRRHMVKPWRLWRLQRLVQRQRPAILHSWMNYTHAYCRFLWGKPRPAMIFGLRDDPEVNLDTGEVVRRRFFLGAVQKADWVVSNSQAALDVLRRRVSRLPAATVVRNIAFPRGRARPAAAAATLRIVAAGALRPLKAYDVLLHACARLAPRPFVVLLAGQGPERPRLEALSAQLGIADRVQFLGEIACVPDLLASAHLLAHPSKSEGLSNTVLEAMAEGLPVVATRVGGTPEIITDGDTGLLVPPACPQALAAAIERLLDDPALRGRLGQAALRYVQEECGMDRIAARYEEIYRAVLREGNVKTE